MLKKLVALTILIAFSFSQLSFSAFDELGTSARAVGMGDNFVAVADDAYSIVYNPAGLGMIHHKEIVTNTNLLYTGLSDMSSITESFAGGLCDTPEYGTFGLGMKWFTAGQLYAENSTFISYGNTFFDLRNRPVYLGANIKMLSLQYMQNLYTENSIDQLGNATGRDPVFAHGYTKSGMSIDLGALTQISDKFSAGIIFKNLNQPDMGLMNASIIPLITKLGVSYKHEGLLVPFEIESTKSDLVFSSGFEKWLSNNQLALRSGLQIGSRNLSNISTGLSYSHKDTIRVDYGFSFPLQSIQNTSGSHRFSIVFSFGASPEDKISSWKNTKEIAPVRKMENFKKGVKAFERNEYIWSYELFRNEAVQNPDTKMRFEAMRYINTIVRRMKNIGPKDPIYNYAQGLLMYMNNNPDEAVKFWNEFLKFDRNNNEIKQVINTLKNNKKIR